MANDFLPINRLLREISKLAWLRCAIVLLLLAGPAGARPPAPAPGDELRSVIPAATPAPAAPAVAARTSAAALANNMEVLDDTRPLAAGDRLSLRIIEDGKPPVEVGVTDSGEMEVPLIGRVKALGKTCRGLAYEIKRSLEKEYFYSCTVILGLDAASVRTLGKIYLTGQVRTTGAMELTTGDPLTVSRAILRAGGFSEFANRKKVKLVRKVPDGKDQTMILDVSKILGGRSDLDLPLQPNDLIVVPERLINF